MTKIANLTLLVTPIVFLIILFFAVGMVGAAGHSSGDITIEVISLLCFSITYGYLMLRKHQNKLSYTQALILIFLTIVLGVVASFYSIMFLPHSLKYLYEIVIFLITFYIAICSIIVTGDIYKTCLLKN
mgnify:CR=1 FL=1